MKKILLLTTIVIAFITCKKEDPAPAPAPSSPSDTTRPVIVVQGNIFDTVMVGTTYTDAGATATDNVDGNITANIVKTGTVNTSTAGNYTLSYNVSDAAGNHAHQKNRFVNVSPQPVVLAGNYSVACNCATLDPGVSSPTVANSTYTAQLTVSSSNVNVFSLSALRVGSITPAANNLNTNGGSTFNVTSVNVSTPGWQGMTNTGVIGSAKNTLTITTDYRVIMYPNMAYTCTNVCTKF